MKSKMSMKKKPYVPGFESSRVFTFKPIHILIEKTTNAKSFEYMDTYWNICLDIRYFIH